MHKMDRINECLDVYRAWYNKVGIHNIEDVNNLIRAGRSDYLINLSETWQEQNISKMAYDIHSNIEKRKIILISGPSGSGKTSLSRRLQLHLQVLGIHSIPISLDDYYIDIKDMPLDDFGKPDFETPESINYSRFNSDISKLITGDRIYIPKFDFDKGVRIENHKEIVLEKDAVIIAEGLHALNPKFADNIPNEYKYKIYCSALTALSCGDGIKIRSRTTRLIRRLIRDYFFRKSDYAFTFSLWPNQELGTERYIFPFTDSADVIFNSSLLYEFAVYKKYLNKVLEGADNDEQYGDKVRELKALVNSFDDLDRDLTPRFSIIREFTGGSALDI